MILLWLLLAQAAFAKSSFAKPCYPAAKSGCTIKPHNFVINGVRPPKPVGFVLVADNSVTLTTTTGHVFFLRCLGAGAGRAFFTPDNKSQLIWTIGRENKGGGIDAADRGLDGYDYLVNCQKETDALRDAVAAGKKINISVDGSGLKLRGESGNVFLGGKAGSTLQMQNDALASMLVDR